MNEWISGKNAVLEALKSKRPVHKVWLLEGMKKASAAPLLSLAREQKVAVQHANRKKLDQLVSHTRHQGVVAQVAAYDYVEWEDLLNRAEKRQEDPFLILLDEIEDPHNLGSIMRTADAAGAHGIIIPKRRAVGLTGAVAKASTGAIEHVPVARVNNVAQTIDRLKEQGIWLVGADADGDTDYREAPLDMPLALVIGSEGKGISRLVKEKCDWMLSLPMRGHVSSLNASVAAALLVYEVYRKRYPLGAQG